MCGIYGGISIKDPSSLLKMMGDTLAHRGPDDQGEYISAGVALGHRRLSIIDLVNGHQPMFSEDKRQVIVYNGEIYNFKEIKEELAKKGHIFKTHSDTEVIINAYREWGYECLHKFNGMFAFALWDNNTRKLWLVRDRIGKKPLYFMRLEGAFYFASEAKALWGVPGFRKELDLRAIDQYLTFRYVPGRRTFYKGIIKLAAANWMLIGEGGEVLQEKQWWDIPQREAASACGKGKLQDYYEEFQDIFSSSVRLRMVSDVPLGLFLSSGMDSSSIAFEMAKVSKPKFITIGFGEKTDEMDNAGMLARSLGAEYHSFLMQEEDFSFFYRAVAALDEPYGDAIILPTYLLAREAAREVKVVLSGDGADEVLGGYIHHEFFRKAPVGLPLAFYRLAASVFSLLPPYALDSLFHYPTSLGDSGKKRVLELLGAYPDLYNSYMSFAAVFSPRDKKQLYSPEFKSRLGGLEDEEHLRMRSFLGEKAGRPLDKVLYWDMKNWFPEQTLMKLDRLSMANSIEGRCPYADHRLVEFLFKLPGKLFDTFGAGKKIIRESYRHELNFVPRPKKAFYLPLHRVYNKKMEELKEEFLNKKDIEKTGLFKYDYIQSLFWKRRASPLLVDKQIMNIVILNLWLANSKKW